MASFATGSVNFTNWIYENPPKFIDELAELLLTQNIKPEIEIFDVSMLYTAHRLAEQGAIRRPLHIQLDRKSVVEGKCEAVLVELGGRRIIKKKNIKTEKN